MSKRIAWAIALCALPSVVAYGQVPDSSLQPGVRIRVVTSQQATGWVTGKLLRIGPDSLEMEVPGSYQSRWREGTYAVPFSRVNRLEVSEGRASRWRNGLKIGSLLGAALGGGVGYVFSEQMSVSKGKGMVYGIAVGAGAGALAGLAIGSLTKKDRWRTVPTDRLRLSLQINPLGRSTLGVAYGIP